MVDQLFCAEIYPFRSSCNCVKDGVFVGLRSGHEKYTNSFGGPPDELSWLSTWETLERSVQTRILSLEAHCFEVRRSNEAYALLMSDMLRSPWPTALFYFVLCRSVFRPCMATFSSLVSYAVWVDRAWVLQWTHFSCFFFLA
jgi:hypothetical protein